MIRKFGMATLILLLAHAVTPALAQSAANPSASSNGGTTAPVPATPSSAPAVEAMPTLPADAAGILSLASRYNGLDAPGLMPWHIAATYETFDAKGQSSAKGTFDDYWLGDGKYKRTYTSSSFTQTEFKTSGGRYRTGNLDSPPYPESLVEDLLLHPLPADKEIQESTPERRTLQAGKVKLECVMLSQKLTNVAFAPLGLFPTYCFSDNKPMLRIGLSFGQTQATFNSPVLFQGRYLAQDIFVQDGQKPLLKIHVERIAAYSSVDPAAFAPPAGSKAIEQQAVQVANGVMAGKLLKQEQPVYPDYARKNRITGTVIMNVLIGRDGHIRNLRLISAPDSSLAISAIAAARSSVYTPFKFNGEPVEVNTTVTMTYNIR